MATSTTLITTHESDIVTSTPITMPTVIKCSCAHPCTNLPADHTPRIISTSPDDTESQSQCSRQQSLHPSLQPSPHTPTNSSGVMSRITRMKLSHRSYGRWESGDESVWYRYRMADTFTDYVKQSFEQLGDHQPTASEYRTCQDWVDEVKAKGIHSKNITHVPRISPRGMTKQEFQQHIEGPQLPCIIGGLSQNWSMNDWSIESLSHPNNPYAHVKFKVDEHTTDRVTSKSEEVDEKDDTDLSEIDALQSNSFKLPLCDFMHYLHHNRDDVPLYVFDAVFDCDPIGQDILKEFEVPDYFTPDLFQYLGEVRRPPYRWILIGPTRSGSALHTDPMATSAWNTCIAGVKRWVLFPPGTDRSAVKGAHLLSPQFLAAFDHPLTEDDISDGMEAVHYFTYSLTKLCADAAATSSSASNSSSTPPSPAAPFGMIEFLQWPGETVFVPHGWLHAVINLTPTIAVTQNYVSTHNFTQSWSEARLTRPHLAQRWREQLELHQPQLFHLTHQLDQQPPLTDVPIIQPSELSTRRPFMDYTLAQLDGDSWYYNPSSDEEIEEEDEVDAKVTGEEDEKKEKRRPHLDSSYR